MRHWGVKAPGIVAKMMSNLDSKVAYEAFGLHIKPSQSEGKHGSPSLMDYWPLILRAKFEQNPRAMHVLRSSAPYTLVEKSRFPRENNFWGAYVCSKEDGTQVIGRNMMGRLIQDVRDSLVIVLD